MMDEAVVDIVVQPLSRELLDGIDDGEGQRADVDVAVLPWFSDERPLQGLAGLVDWRLGGALSTMIRQGFCTGAADEVVLLPGRRTLPMRRLVLVGLGPAATFDREAAKRAGRRIVDLVGDLHPRDVLVAMPGSVSERSIVESVFDGVVGALRTLDAEAQARPAARAVGDEGSVSSTAVAANESTTTPQLVSTQETATLDSNPGATTLGVAQDPVTTEIRPKVDPPVGPGVGAGVGTASADEPLGEAAAVRWRVVADPRHEARLRRLLEGPPRAAQPQT